MARRSVLRVLIVALLSLSVPTHSYAYTWTKDTSVGIIKHWNQITSSSDGTKLAAVAASENIWTSTNAANLVGVLFLSAAPSFVSALGAARVGETCSSDDDCYDRGSCLGVCCSRSDITNCLTCGATKTDSLYGTTFYYCTECEAGYETYNYMGMTGEVHCRKSCEEGEFFPWASSDSCTALYTDGQNCYGNDASCASGTCGENYCCGTAQMSSVFEEFSMCCTLCSDTGACLAQADCQQHPPPSASNTTNVTSPPPPNAPAPPTPSQPSPPPPNRLIFGGDYESSATRYSVVTALVVSIIIQVRDL